MSRYLRSLLPEGYVELELAMPAAAERIETLVRLVGKTNGSLIARIVAGGIGWSFLASII